MATGRRDDDRRAEPDEVLGAAPHLARERERLAVANRLGPFVVVEETARDCRRRHLELPRERSAELSCPIDAPHHERDARAEAAALIERDDVVRESARRFVEVRPRRHDRDPHPRSVPAHPHVGADVRSDGRDRRVASVDVHLAVRHTPELPGDRDARITESIDQRARKRRRAPRRLHHHPLGRGERDRDCSERRDEDVRGEHDVNRLGIARVLDQRANVVVARIGLDVVRQPEPHPFERQAARPRDLRSERRRRANDGLPRRRHSTDIRGAFGEGAHVDDSVPSEKASAETTNEGRTRGVDSPA